jgi:hypothetical protein
MRIDTRYCKCADKAGPERVPVRVMHRCGIVRVSITAVSGALRADPSRTVRHGAAPRRSARSGTYVNVSRISAPYCKCAGGRTCAAGKCAMRVRALLPRTRGKCGSRHADACKWQYRARQQARRRRLIGTASKARPVRRQRLTRTRAD